MLGEHRLYDEDGPALQTVWASLAAEALRPVIRCSSVAPMHLGKSLLAGLVASLVWTASAGAQSSDQAQARLKAGAAQGEAKMAYDQGRYVQAARAYLQAYDILIAVDISRPGLLYNAGLAFEQLSDCDRAADLYVRYLAEAPERTTRALTAQIAAATACAPKAAVNSTPPGARVLIDGQDRGQTPLALHLKPGNYTLTLDKPGYDPVRQAIAHQSTSPFIFNAQLKPAQAQLILNMTYTGEVFLDDEHIATGPYRGQRSLSVGQHKLRIEVRGCEAQHLTIELQQGHDTNVSPDKHCIPLPEDPPKLVLSTSPPKAAAAGPSVGVWSSGGAGLVALLAGGAFSTLYVRAADRRDHLDADESELESAPIRAADDAAGRWGIAAGVSFGAAAIGLGSALVLWLTDEPVQETVLSATANGLRVRF